MMEAPFGKDAYKRAYQYGPRRVKTAVKLAGSVYGAFRGAAKSIKNMKARGEDAAAGAVRKGINAAKSVGRVARGDFREVGGAARDIAAGVIKKTRRARDRYSRAQKSVDYNNDLAKIERMYGAGAAEYSKQKFARLPYGGGKNMKDALQMAKDYIRNPMNHMMKNGSRGYTPRIERAADKSQRLGAKIVGGATFGAGAAYGGYMAQKKAARGGK